LEINVALRVTDHPESNEKFVVSGRGEFHFEALMPTRTLLGLKSYLLTATKGTVSMYTSFEGYNLASSAEMKNNHGSLVSLDTGTSTGYSLDNAQARGTLFVKAATDVYAGMVIGQSSRDEDLELNPYRDKKLTNIRSKSSGDGIALIPPRILSLEESLEYLGGDELLEVTPINYRIRKSYLDPNERRKHRQR